MTSDPGTFVGDRPRTRRHFAWVVAGVTLGALVAAAAFRSSTGVLLEPIEAEFGWSRAVTSGAVSLNLVLYGLTAPFAAAFMERCRSVGPVCFLSTRCLGLARSTVHSSSMPGIGQRPVEMMPLCTTAVGVTPGPETTPSIR